MLGAKANMTCLLVSKQATCKLLTQVLLFVQPALTMADIQAEVLRWNYSRVVQGIASASKNLPKVPTRFDSLQQYCSIFRQLLLAELQAHMLQVCC